MKAIYECKFQPSHALKQYDFFANNDSPMGRDLEIWYAEYNSKQRPSWNSGGTVYSWRAWMLKSRATSIFDCKDPHVDDMLDHFNPVALEQVIEACIGHHSSNMIWENNGRIRRAVGPPPWSHLRSYFTRDQQAAAIRWLRERDAK